MELLESNTPKRELMKKSELHRAALEDEVKLISERTEKVLTNALIIGGALALSYFVVRQFAPRTKKSKVKAKRIAIKATPVQEVEEEYEEPKAVSVVAEIGTAVAAQVTTFLLALAKEKLMEYLESQTQKKSEKEA